MDVTINVAIDRSADFDKTVAKASRHGLKVSSKYQSLGVISGRIEQAKLDSLRRLTGVKSVEEDRAVSAVR